MTKFSSLKVVCGLLLAVFRLPHFVSANCECGYSVNATSDPVHEVYTDLIESDFLTIQNLTLNTDWEVRTYRFPVVTGRLGKIAQLKNVVSNPLKDNSSLSGPGVLGGDAGTQIYVRGGRPVDGLVPMGEMRTRRQDLLYGSFRASMKLTATHGTCGGFFWYFNDTQEIDMEFLSRQFNATSSPVNLALQSKEAELAGFDASKTPTFKFYQLPFKPDKGFHEYRFDWTSEKVSFYADGKWLVDMDTSIPTEPGGVYINHWSDGRPGWSGGPPDKDAALTVAYVKAYFNSSDATRQHDHATRCKNPSAAGAICQIPDLPRGKDQSTGSFFFTERRSMSDTYYGGSQKSATGPAMSWAGWWLLFSICVMGL